MRRDQAIIEEEVSSDLTIAKDKYTGLVVAQCAENKNVQKLLNQKRKTSGSLNNSDKSVACAMTDDYSGACWVSAEPYDGKDYKVKICYADLNFVRDTECVVLSAGETRGKFSAVRKTFGTKDVGYTGKYDDTTCPDVKNEINALGYAFIYEATEPTTVYKDEDDFYTNYCEPLSENYNPGTCLSPSYCPCNTEECRGNNFLPPKDSETWKKGSQDLKNCYRCHQESRAVRFYCKKVYHCLHNKGGEIYNIAKSDKRELIKKLYGKGVYTCGYYNGIRCGCAKTRFVAGPRHFLRIARIDDTVNKVAESVNDLKARPQYNLFNSGVYVRQFYNDKYKDEDRQCPYEHDAENGWKERGTFFYPKITIVAGSNERKIGYYHINGDFDRNNAKFYYNQPIGTGYTSSNNTYNLPTTNKIVFSNFFPRIFTIGPMYNMLNDKGTCSSKPAGSLFYIMLRLEYNMALNESVLVAYKVTNISYMPASMTSSNPSVIATSGEFAKFVVDTSTNTAFANMMKGLKYNDDENNNFTHKDMNMSNRYFLFENIGKVRRPPLKYYYGSNSSYLTSPLMVEEDRETISGVDDKFALKAIVSIVPSMLSIATEPDEFQQDITLPVASARMSVTGLNTDAFSVSGNKLDNQDTTGLTDSALLYMNKYTLGYTNPCVQLRTINSEPGYGYLKNPKTDYTQCSSISAPKDRYHCILSTFLVEECQGYASCMHNSTTISGCQTNEGEKRSPEMKLTGNENTLSQYKLNTDFRSETKVCITYGFDLADRLSDNSNTKLFGKFGNPVYDYTIRFKKPSGSIFQLTPSRPVSLLGYDEVPNANNVPQDKPKNIITMDINYFSDSKSHRFDNMMKRLKGTYLVSRATNLSTDENLLKHYEPDCETDFSKCKDKFEVSHRLINEIKSDLCLYSTNVNGGVWDLKDRDLATDYHVYVPLRCQYVQFEGYGAGGAGMTTESDTNCMASWDERMTSYCIFCPTCGGWPWPMPCWWTNTYRKVPKFDATGSEGGTAKMTIDINKIPVFDGYLWVSVGARTKKVRYKVPKHTGEPHCFTGVTTDTQAIVVSGNRKNDPWIALGGTHQFWHMVNGDNNSNKDSDKYKGNSEIGFNTYGAISVPTNTAMIELYQNNLNEAKQSFEDDYKGLPLLIEDLSNYRILEYYLVTIGYYAHLLDSYSNMLYIASRLAYLKKYDEIKVKIDQLKTEIANLQTNLSSCNTEKGNLLSTYNTCNTNASSYNTALTNYNNCTDDCNNDYLNKNCETNTKCSSSNACITKFCSSQSSLLNNAKNNCDSGCYEDPVCKTSKQNYDNKVEECDTIQTNINDKTTEKTNLENQINNLKWDDIKDVEITNYSHQLVDDEEDGEEEDKYKYAKDLFKGSLFSKSVSYTDISEFYNKLNSGGNKSIFKQIKETWKNNENNNITNIESEEDNLQSNIDRIEEDIAGDNKTAEQIDYLNRTKSIYTTYKSSKTTEKDLKVTENSEINNFSLTRVEKPIDAKSKVNELENKINSLITDGVVYFSGGPSTLADEIKELEDTTLPNCLSSKQTKETEYNNCYSICVTNISDAKKEYDDCTENCSLRYYTLMCKKSLTFRGYCMDKSMCIEEHCTTYNNNYRSAVANANNNNSCKETPICNTRKQELARKEEECKDIEDELKNKRNLLSQQSNKTEYSEYLIRVQNLFNGSNSHTSINYSNNLSTQYKDEHYKRYELFYYPFCNGIESNSSNCLNDDAILIHSGCSFDGNNFISYANDLNNSFQSTGESFTIEAGEYDDGNGNTVTLDSGQDISIKERFTTSKIDEKTNIIKNKLNNMSLSGEQIQSFATQLQEIQNGSSNDDKYLNYQLLARAHRGMSPVDCRITGNRSYCPYLPNDSEVDGPDDYYGVYGSAKGKNLFKHNNTMTLSETRMSWILNGVNTSSESVGGMGIAIGEFGFESLTARGSGSNMSKNAASDWKLDVDYFRDGDKVYREDCSGLDVNEGGLCGMKSDSPSGNQKLTDIKDKHNYYNNKAMSGGAFMHRWGTGGGGKGSVNLTLGTFVEIGENPNTSVRYAKMTNNGIKTLSSTGNGNVDPSCAVRCPPINVLIKDFDFWAKTEQTYKKVDMICEYSGEPSEDMEGGEGSEYSPKKCYILSDQTTLDYGNLKGKVLVNEDYCPISKCVNDIWGLDNYIPASKAVSLDKLQYDRKALLCTHTIKNDKSQWYNIMMANKNIYSSMGFRGSKLATLLSQQKDGDETLELATCAKATDGYYIEDEFDQLSSANLILTCSNGFWQDAKKIQTPSLYDIPYKINDMVYYKKDGSGTTAKLKSHSKNFEDYDDKTRDKEYNSNNGHMYDTEYLIADVNLKINNNSYSGIKNLSTAGRILFKDKIKCPPISNDFDFDSGYSGNAVWDYANEYAKNVYATSCRDTATQKFFKTSAGLPYRTCMRNGIWGPVFRACTKGCPDEVDKFGTKWSLSKLGENWLPAENQRIVNVSGNCSGNYLNSQNLSMNTNSTSTRTCDLIKGEWEDISGGGKCDDTIGCPSDDFSFSGGILVPTPRMLSLQVKTNGFDILYEQIEKGQVELSKYSFYEDSLYLIFNKGVGNSAMFSNVKYFSVNNNYTDVLFKTDINFANSKGNKYSLDYSNFENFPAKDYIAILVKLNNLTPKAFDYMLAQGDDNRNEFKNIENWVKNLINKKQNFTGQWEFKANMSSTNFLGAMNQTPVDSQQRYKNSEMLILIPKISNSSQLTEEEQNEINEIKRGYGITNNNLAYEYLNVKNIARFSPLLAKQYANQKGVRTDYIKDDTNIKLRFLSNFSPKDFPVVIFNGVNQSNRLYRFEWDKNGKDWFEYPNYAGHTKGKNCNGEYIGYIHHNTMKHVYFTPKPYNSSGVYFVSAFCYDGHIFGYHAFKSGFAQNTVLTDDNTSKVLLEETKNGELFAKNIYDDIIAKFPTAIEANQYYTIEENAYIGGMMMRYWQSHIRPEGDMYDLFVNRVDPSTDTSVEYATDENVKFVLQQYKNNSKGYYFRVVPRRSEWKTSMLSNRINNTNDLVKLSDEDPYCEKTNCQNDKRLSDAINNKVNPEKNSSGNYIWSMCEV